jgi:hypothetical protein
MDKLARSVYHGSDSGDACRGRRGDRLHRTPDSAAQHKEVIRVTLSPAPGVQTRWSSFENPLAAAGRGGMSNRGAKGHALEWVRAGESCTLLDVRGSGLITRIWLTVDDSTPAMLRALRLDIYWDAAERPAVSAPWAISLAWLGAPRRLRERPVLGPRGTQLNCFVPMPFRRRARIVLTNEWTVPYAASSTTSTAHRCAPRRRRPLLARPLAARIAQRAGAGYAVLPPSRARGAFWDATWA